MTPAQLFFGLYGHSTEKNRAEVALFVSLPDLCLSECDLVRQVLDQFANADLNLFTYIYVYL